MEDKRTVVEVDVDESGVSVGGSVGVVAFSTVGGEDLREGGGGRKRGQRDCSNGEEKGEIKSKTYIEVTEVVSSNSERSSSGSSVGDDLRREPRTTKDEEKSASFRSRPTDQPPVPPLPSNQQQTSI